ncbi:MAG: PGPGW domain-containing protein [Betaproteobacteria bacterium]
MQKHGQRKWYAGFLEVPSLRVAKRIVVAVLGGTVTLIGVALIVLPGPAFIVIPIGLSILATEFLWAKRWLAKARKMTARIMAKSRSDG